MALLTIGEAAALLHTAPSTIRSWEQRLGYPKPTRSSSGHRLYDESEIALLADALHNGLSISSAIRHVQRETGAYDTLLRRALSELDHVTCDSLLESAIAMCGVSRAFDETVLEAVAALFAMEHDPAVAALAVEWASDRACWSRRQAVDIPQRAIVIADGSAEGSVTRVATRVLELQLALRCVLAHTLHGPAVSSFRSVARNVDAAAIVLVGAPPASGYRGDSMAYSRVTGFRLESELWDQRIEMLPPQPREAADELLVAFAADSPAGDGARPGRDRDASPEGASNVR